MPTARFAVLDSWRGIAALCVAAFHFGTTSHIQNAAFLRHSWLFVIFFFVLSGFVISHGYFSRLERPAQLWRFVLQRFGRLYPLHLFMLLLYLALELAKFLAVSRGLTHFQQEPFTGANSITSFFTNLLLIHALGIEHGLTWNGPSWSISVEFFTYLIFGAIVCFAPRPRIWFLGLIGASVAVLASFSPRFMGADINFALFRCLFGFFLGHFVWCAVNWAGACPARLKSIRRWGPGLEIGSLALAVAFIVAIGRHSPLGLAAPLVFGLVVFVFAFETGPLSRLLGLLPFQKMGAWSYSIYMVHSWIHWCFVIVFSSLLPKFFGIEMAAWDGRESVLGNSPISGDLLLLGFLAATLAMSALTHRFVEEPGRAYFRDLSNRIVDEPLAPVLGPERA